MPLLRRQPFVPASPPPDLRPDEEVFFCPLTKEIFRSYEDFFERTILCNSLVWSCSLTGKSNLTYQEAVESEKRAVKLATDLPEPLKRAMLFVAHLTRRGKINDASDDVYYFMKDRYFIGEKAEAILRNRWYPCKVAKVVSPTVKEVEEYKVKDDEDLSADDKIQLLNQYGPPPELLKYEVEEEDRKNGGVTTSVVTVDCIRREKGVYSQNKVRMYLRHCMEFNDDSGVWEVKSGALQKYVGSLKYSDIFTGCPPTFDESRQPKKASRAAQSITERSDKRSSTSTKTTPKKTSPESGKNPLDMDRLNDEFVKIREEREKFRNEMKQLAEKKKLEREEEKLSAKEKKKEEKRQLAEYLKEWNKARDDLECDDLKELPTPTAVHCRIPNALFGDFLLILEFLLCFNEELQLKDNFPGGVSFELLERAITEKEVAGPLSDILQSLLRAIFEYQQAEAEEVKEATSVDDEAAAETGPTYLGTSLDKLSLDALTVSEVVRLHLVSSGGRSSELRSKWRYQQRGGYNNADDPGVQFRAEEPHILHALGMQTVYDLSAGDKLKIIRCLCNQILTYVSVRDVIEEKTNKLAQLRLELRTLHGNERRHRREDTINRAKLKLDEEAAPNSEELAAQRQRLDKEEAKRRAEYTKKEQQLQQAIAKLQMSVHIPPLGQDRAFRRFWMFNSCPGLFVEHDDEFVGPCLPSGTPQPPAELNSNKSQDIRNFFKKEESNQPSKKEIKYVFGACNGDPATCTVHATYLPRTRWSFYETAEDLDKLLVALNDRGIRESTLKQTILQDKERILESISRTPVYRLDTNKEEPASQQAEVRKSTRQLRKEREYDANMNFPPGTPVNSVMELTLRDMILETEEKIFLGGLGSLKVDDRIAWRTAIENGSYDSRCKYLTWGGKPAKESAKSTKSAEAEPMEQDDEDSISGRSSSADGSSITGDIQISASVKDLGCALLQLAQSVEAKYLKKPLGEDEKEKKKRLKAEESMKKWEDKETGDGPKAPPKEIRTPLEQWELSLHACTNVSQLYVHFAILDNSITWNRSALNARCRLCRRKGDPEKMLLCDGCDRGYHVYCLRPPLSNVPEGDWFCMDCRPKEKPRTPRKERRAFSEVSDEDEANGSAEEEEAEQEENEEVAEEEESESESVHQEVCAICYKGGHVICCDTCPNVYHMECLEPPLKKVPRGKWACPQCQPPPAKPEATKLKEKNTENQPVSTRSRAKLSLDFDEKPEQASKPRTRGNTEPAAGSKRRPAAEASTLSSRESKRSRGESWDDDSSGRFSQRRRFRPLPVPSSTVDAGEVDMAVLEGIVADLMAHKDGWPFLRPVTRAEAPDYHVVIKQPMDFGTIKYKLNSIQYNNTEEFLDDLRLVFDNCYSYNVENAEEYKCAQRLSIYLDELLRKAGFKLPSGGLFA